MNQPPPDRLPPQSREAERSVLGCVLRHNACLDDVRRHVRGAADFYHDAHRTVFAAECDLIDQGKPCDLVTLAEELIGRDQLDDAGGAAFLAQLWDEGLTAGAVEHHAAIVADKALVRAVGGAGHDILRLADGRQAGGAELLDEAERKILALGDAGTDFLTLEAPALVAAANARLEQRMDPTAPEITGIATGWADLDDMLCGLRDGELTYVAARPGQGKTSFASQLALHAAVEQQKHVLFVSLEQSHAELTDRLVPCLGRIDAQRVRKGRLTDAELEDWNRAGERLAASRLAIDCTPGLALAGIRSLARRRKRAGKLDLLVVDYIGLVEPADRRVTRSEQIAAVSRGLHLLARELSVHGVIPAQLNRDSEKDNRRPRLSDLRDSGSQEQDAHNVLLLHPEPGDEPGAPKLLNVIVAKQRNGPTGDVRLLHVPQYLRYENFAGAGTPFDH